MPSIPSSPVREEYEPDPQKGSGEAAALPKAKRQRESSPGQTSALNVKGAVRPKTMADKDDGADTAGGDRSGSLPVRSAEEGAAEGAEGEVHSSVTDEATTGATALEVASSAGQPSTPAAATKDVTPPVAPTNTDVVPPSTTPPAAASSPAPAPDAEQVLQQNNPRAGISRTLDAPDGHRSRSRQAPLASLAALLVGTLSWSSRCCWLTALSLAARPSACSREQTVAARLIR